MDNQTSTHAPHAPHGMLFEDYWNLPTSAQWLATPYEIGGYPSDVAQLGFNLRHQIRQVFRINQVPPEVVAQLEKTVAILTEGQEAVEELVNLVSREKQGEIDDIDE